MIQLTLTDACTAEALKAQGLARVSATAETFVAVMRKKAREISEQSGFVSCDNLRVYASTMGLVPHAPQAWGAIFTGKHWKQIGFQKSKLATNHARRISVWRWEP